MDSLVESALVLSGSALQQLGRGSVEGGGDIHPPSKAMSAEKFPIKKFLIKNMAHEIDTKYLYKKIGLNTCGTSVRAYPRPISTPEIAQM
eukprot:9503712-Pyramimonas_sp.AAC.1